MKRGADRQLGPKDSASDDEPEDAGTFEKASNEEISGRRMFKKGGKKSTTPVPTSTTTTTTQKSDSDRITKLENEVFDLRAQVQQILEKLNMPATTTTKPAAAEPKKDNAPSITGSFSFGDASTNKNDLVNLNASGAGFNFGDSKTTTSTDNDSTSGGFKFTSVDTTTTSSTTPFAFNFGSSSQGATSTFSSFSKQNDSNNLSFSQSSQKDGEDDGVPAWSGSGDYEAPDSQPAAEVPPSVTLLHSSEEKVQTGEEDETTLCQFKVKLFELEKKGDTNNTDWGERGVGVIKLNEKKDKSSARLLMRKEQVLTLILNAVVFAEMKCQKPQEKSLLISTFTAGQPISYLIKFQKAADCDQLKNSIDEIKVRLGGKKE